MGQVRTQKESKAPRGIYFLKKKEVGWGGQDIERKWAMGTYSLIRVEVRISKNLERKQASNSVRSTYFLEKVKARVEIYQNIRREQASKENSLSGKVRG